MTYYKVKPEFDQKNRPDGGIFVNNELYTKRELDELLVSDYSFFDIVNVSKNDTYWHFGARFSL